MILNEIFEFSHDRDLLSLRLQCVYFRQERALIGQLALPLLRHLICEAESQGKIIILLLLLNWLLRLAADLVLIVWPLHELIRIEVVLERVARMLMRLHKLSCIVT